MKLTQLGLNQTQITKPDGTIVFYSYNTPVAGYTREHGFVRTSKFFSKTTRRHVDKWLDGRDATLVPQEFLDNL